jgi:hypothetical protein
MDIFGRSPTDRIALPKASTRVGAFLAYRRKDNRLPKRRLSLKSYDGKVQKQRLKKCAIYHLQGRLELK